MKASGQDDLFGSAAATAVKLDVNWKRVPEQHPDEKLRLEKETLGLYLTAHPVDRFIAEFKQFCSCRLNDVQPTKRGDTITIAGLVVSVRMMQTKTGIPWAIVTLDDKSSRIEAKLFSEAYEKARALISEDKVLVLEGEVFYDEYTERPSMTVRGAWDIASARERFAQRLEVQINSQLAVGGFVEKLTGTLRDFGPGHCAVVVDYRNGEACVRATMGEQFKVSPRDELLHRLKQIDGCERVEIVYS
jgi:DNA polymerase-3 subunit alpha